MSGSPMQVDAIQVGARHRRDLGDVAALATSIAEIGLLHPIVVNSAGELSRGRAAARGRQAAGLERSAGHRHRP
jgi:ParB family chromosome partitioning protein